MMSISPARPPLPTTDRLLLVASAVALVHYVALAVRGDPLNVGTLFSLVAASAGAGLFIARRGGLRLATLRPRTRRILWACLAAIAAYTLVMSGWMLAQAHSEEHQPVDVVLVLGAGLKNGRPSPTLERRIEAASEYLVKHPDIDVVACGGVGHGQPLSEAEAIRDGLIARGVTAERIVLEDRSTSTEENLRFAEPLVRRRVDRERPRVLITTSTFHLARAKLLAERLGYEPFGLPAPTPWTSLPNHAARESLALLKSFVWAIFG